MDSTADLNAALGFVIRRIEEKATQSGEPLEEEHRFLPTNPDAPVFNAGDTAIPMDFVPRDITYERLCALAKAGYRRDAGLNPGMQDWDFAFYVSKLYRHPMCWLLQWAGVKQQRPWWDRWVLVGAALLWIIVTMSLMLLVIDNGWVLWRWAVVVVGSVGSVLFMLSVSRRIEDRLLRENIERCRGASRIVCTYTMTDVISLLA